MKKSSAQRAGLFGRMPPGRPYGVVKDVAGKDFPGREYPKLYKTIKDRTDKVLSFFV